MTSNWISSRNNFNDDVLSSLKLPKRVQLYDITCRDGEQMPGLVFRKKDKIRIAQVLDELGISRIEAGMPAVSNEDMEAAREIAHLGLSARVQVLCRARKEDVDLALKCDLGSVIIEVPSSDSLIEEGFRWNRERALKEAVDVTTYAKEHGLNIVFFPYDTTRADHEFLRKLITSVIESSHIESTTVVDTFGCASPHGIASLVRKVKSWVSIPVEVHCHNDCGVATANSVAAVAAGAEVVHTTMNGVGERTGQAATEQVAMALRMLYNVDVGIKFEKLYSVSKLVEGMVKECGVSVESLRPVVGDGAFTYEAGAGAMAIYRMRSPDMIRVILPYKPEFVGNKQNLVLGKKSGNYSIALKLREMGKTATDPQLDEMLVKIKKLSVDNKRAVTQKEFEDIVKATLG